MNKWEGSYSRGTVRARCSQSTCKLC